MKRRILSLLLAAVLLCALLPMSGAQAAELRPFSDVPSDAWYAPYVYALVQQGIINGMTETTFAPNQPLTRAQLMKMLVCFAVDDAAIKAAASAQRFTDVAPGQWYAGHVNWAAEKGVTNGYEDGSFRPNQSVTRAETATLANRFTAVADGAALKPTKDKTLFTDDAEIPAWAKESVYLCQQAGVINGYPEGDFRGGRQITRAEAAKVLCLLFGTKPLPQDAIPKPPVNTAVRTLPSSAAGYGVTGIEFDPQGYRAGIVLANDRFYATESPSNMVRRSGAAIACNGASFSGDLTTWSSMILNGRALRIDNAHAGQKCYFVVDDHGRASMQYLTIHQTAKLVRNGQTLATYEEVGCNLAIGEGDGSRMVFTRAFGAQVPVKMKCAVFCDENGVVTGSIDAASAQTISIPEQGFVLCCRARRDEGQAYLWDNFFSEAKPGDRVELSLSYDNSSVQNIQMAFSHGPTVVKNGAVYGNSSTYAAEGFDASMASGSAQRMAIGVKADGTVVMASATCDLQGLGRVMQALGCQNAFNLDGGASCALYVSGSARVAPGRNLTHLIIFQAR